MKDRFKFRAWDKRTNSYYNPLDKDINGLTLAIRDNVANFDMFAFDLELSSIVMEQCTGAKDCYRDLIYEGDILEIWEDRGIAYVKVVWNDEQKKWDVEGDTEVDYDFWELVDREVGDRNNDVGVVGNIHENAELLEGK